MFLDHTQRRTTIGRTPLDEWSARRRDLYLTTLTTNIHDAGGIRTHILSRRAAADFGLRPRGHWDRRCTLLETLNSLQWSLYIPEWWMIIVHPWMVDDRGLFQAPAPTFAWKAFRRIEKCPHRTFKIQIWFSSVTSGEWLDWQAVPWNTSLAILLKLYTLAYSPSFQLGAT